MLKETVSFVHRKGKLTRYSHSKKAKKRGSPDMQQATLKCDGQPIDGAEYMFEDSVAVPDSLGRCMGPAFRPHLRGSTR